MSYLSLNCGMTIEINLVLELCREIYQDSNSLNYYHIELNINKTFENVIKVKISQLIQKEALMDILGRRFKLTACEYSLFSSFVAVRDVSVASATETDDVNQCLRN